MTDLINVWVSYERSCGSLEHWRWARILLSDQSHRVAGGVERRVVIGKEV